MSFHVSFLYESSSCGTCCLFKNKSTPAVSFLKKSMAAALYLFCLLLSLVEKKGRKVKQSTNECLSN